MAVLLLQAALIDESNFTFLRYCPTVESIQLSQFCLTEMILIE
jgi:hypothetical protein